MIKLSSPGADLPTGGQWIIDVCVEDAYGTPSSDTLTIAVTDPAGAVTTPSSEDGAATGSYRITIPVDQAGRWVATVVGDTYGAAATSAYVAGVVTASGMPNIADLDDYLGTHSWSDDDLAEALAAETDAQRRVCRIPAAYPNDLRSALLRRCQFHLAMKRVQLGVVPGDADRDTIRPGSDPEVRRFERPWRRLPVG